MTQAADLIAFCDDTRLGAEVWRTVLSTLGVPLLDVAGTFATWYSDARSRLEVLLDLSGPGADGDFAQQRALEADANIALAVLDEFELDLPDNITKPRARAIDPAARLARACESLDDLGEVRGRPVSDVHGRIVARYLLGSLLRRQGENEAAERHLHEVLDQRNVGFSHGRALAAYKLALASISSGNIFVLPEEVDRAHADAVRSGFYSRFATHRARGLFAFSQQEFGSASDEFANSVSVLEEHRSLDPFVLGVEAVAGYYLLAAAQHAEGASGKKACASIMQAVSIIRELHSGWHFTAGDSIPDPLTRPFTMVYRNAARIAAECGDADTALTVIEATKRSALAGLLRASRSHLDGRDHERLAMAVDEITRAENDLVLGTVHPDEVAAEIARLRDLLGQELSEIGAAAYVPEEIDGEGIRRRLGQRIGVTYLTVDEDKPEFVAVVVLPERPLEVQLITFGAYDQARDVVLHPDRYTTGHSQVAWQEVAEMVLPAAFSSAVTTLQPDSVHGLPSAIFSPDGPLVGLPWAGLPFGPTMSPLVCSADLGVTPALSLLGPGNPDTVTTSDGAVVAVLVDYGSPDDPAPLDYSAEHQALLSLGCEPTTNLQGFRKALSEEAQGGTPRLAYVAGHGAGTGLEQQILDSGGIVSLDGALALGLPWPPLVVLAGCYTGNYTSAAGMLPLGLAISCLIAGATRVVACAYEAVDRPTSTIHADLLRELCSPESAGRSETALANVQRAFLSRYPGSHDVLARFAAPQCLIVD